ncbi:MAG TPA: hypothetical protein VFP46_00840, partial [Candidatus Paceibacterota bacterium]|nr:hypothetical protein [Candidatus Paceibacterota bacterium]
MNPYSSWQWRRVLELFVMAMGFVFVSYEVRTHEEIIRVLLSGTHALGPVVFVLFTALFVVFVIPLDIVFLIPIGVLLWGPVATGFLSIV